MECGIEDLDTLCISIRTRAVNDTLERYAEISKQLVATALVYRVMQSVTEPKSFADLPYDVFSPHSKGTRHGGKIGGKPASPDLDGGPQAVEMYAKGTFD